MNPTEYQPRDFRWSQRDPRWAWKKIGTSVLTVGDVGCASVAANYAVNRAWLKLGIPRFARPGEFVDYCNTHGFYTATSLLKWEAVNYFSAGKLLYSKTKPGSFITLQEVRWGALNHWIALIDTTLCLNPWTGAFEQRNQSIWEPTGKERYFKLA